MTVKKLVTVVGIVLSVIAVLLVMTYESGVSQGIPG
jgi:hypothetical protein